MRIWRPGVKKLEEKIKKVISGFGEDRENLLNKIISSVNKELFAIYKEILRDYGLKGHGCPFLGYKLKDFGRGKKYAFYLWRINLDLVGGNFGNFLLLVLYGDRKYELPDSFELESADNYNPNFKQTYQKGISPKGLRLLFRRQLKKMGFQKK